MTRIGYIGLCYPIAGLLLQSPALLYTILPQYFASVFFATIAISGICGSFVAGILGVFENTKPSDVSSPVRWTGLLLSTIVLLVSIGLFLHE